MGIRLVNQGISLWRAVVLPGRVLFVTALVPPNGEHCTEVLDVRSPATVMVLPLS